MRYCLITDDDAHWYICPADRVEEADRMFEALDRYWNGDMKGRCPKEPDFVIPVNGSPHLVTFTDPKVG